MPTTPSTPTVAVIPTLKDNFSFVIHSHQQAIIIDPGEAEPIQQFLTDHNLRPLALLITHHHHDHRLGCQALQQHNDKPPVFSSTPFADYQHWHHWHSPTWQHFQQQVRPLFGSIHITPSPGHSLDQVFIQCDHHVFTADALFAAGSGKNFESTWTQFNQSLQPLVTLHQNGHNPWLYVGHDYTADALAFASQLAQRIHRHAHHPIWPQTLDQIQQRQQALGNHRVTNKHHHQPFCTPSSLDLEWQTNPFLWWHDQQKQPTLQHWLHDFCSQYPQFFQGAGLPASMIESGALWISAMRLVKDYWDQNKHLD